MLLRTWSRMKTQTRGTHKDFCLLWSKIPLHAGVSICVEGDLDDSFRYRLHRLYLISVMSSNRRAAKAWCLVDRRQQFFFVWVLLPHIWHFFPDLHKSPRSCQLPYSTREHLGVKETWTGNLSVSSLFLPACMPTLNINELTACFVKMHGVTFVLNSNQISFHFHNIPGSRACRAAQQRTKGRSSPPPLRQCMSE